MKENVDKHIENLVARVMKKTSLESPTFEFTSNVMSEVVSFRSIATTTTTTSYQPLISKRVWVVIFVGFVAFIAYIVLVTKPEASSWFNSFDMNFLNTDKLVKMFDGLKFSKSIAYCIGVLSIMLLIQIPVIKHYFDK